MEITCEKCGAIIPLDTEQTNLPGEIACPVCWELFQVTGETLKKGGEVLYGEGRREGWKGDILGFDVRSGGGAYIGYFDPYLLKAKIWNRELSGEEEIRPEGGEWVPIYDVNEFREVFRLLGVDPEFLTRKRTAARQRVVGWQTVSGLKKAKKEKILDSFSPAGEEAPHPEEAPSRDEEQVKKAPLFTGRRRMALLAIPLIILLVLAGYLLLPSLWKGGRGGPEDEREERVSSGTILLDNTLSLLMRDDPTSYERVEEILREDMPERGKGRTAILPLLIETLLFRYGNDPHNIEYLKEAEKLVDELEKEGVKGDALYLRAKGRFLLMKGEIGSALEILKDLPERDPLLLCLKSEALIEAGEKAEGEALLSGLIDSDPEYIRPHALLLWERLKSEGEDFIGLVRDPLDFPTMNETLLIGAEYARFIRGERGMEGTVKRIMEHLLSGAVRSLTGEGRAYFLIHLMLRKEEMADAAMVYLKRAWGCGVVPDEDMKDSLGRRLPSIDFDEWKKTTYTRRREEKTASLPSVTRAEELIRKRNYVEALSLLEDELTRDEDSPLLHLLLYRVLFHSGIEKKESAFSHLLKGMKGEYILPALFAEAGNAIEEGEELDLSRVQEAMRERIEEDPTEDRLFFELGRLFSGESGIRGMDYILRATQLDPFNPEYLLKAGNILHAAGKDDEARSFIEKSIFLKEDNPLAYFSLASLDEAAGDYRGAIEILRKGSGIDPNEWTIPARIGVITIKEGKIEEGIKRLEKAKGYVIKNHDLHLYLGIGYIKRGAAGDMERAKSEFFRALEIEPHSILAHLELGKIYMEQEEYLAAQGEFEKALAGEPENIPALDGLANALYEQGAYEDAIENYEKLLKLSPDASNLYLRLGRCYHNLDRGDIALKYYRKVGRDDPAQAEVSYRMGLIYETKGKRDEAGRLYLKAISINPSFPPPYRTLGYLYKDENNCQKSLEYLEKYIRLEKDEGEVNMVKTELSFIREDCRDLSTPSP